MSHAVGKRVCGGLVASGAALLLGGCAERILEEFELRVLHQCVRIPGRAEGYALVDRRQEGCAEVVDTAMEACRADRDEARQVLVLGAQSVAHPAAHARAQQGVAAGEELHAGTAVGDVLVAEAVDHAQLVGDLRQVLPQFAHRDPALAGRAELPGRGEEVAARGELHPRTFEGGWLAVVLLQRRFRIEEVDMRRSAVHEEKDDPLGAWLEVRLLHREGVRRAFSSRLVLGVEQVRKGQSSEAEAPGPEQVAPAREIRFWSQGVEGHRRSLTGIVSERRGTRWT